MRVRTSPPGDPLPPCRALTCGYQVCVEQGRHSRHPEGLLQARLPPQPMGLTLQGKRPFLGEAPQGHRAGDREQSP